MMDLIIRTLQASIDLLNDASVWLVISFVLAGLLHNVLSPDKMHRMMGDKSFGSLARGTVSGMMLPVCSCGVIPLGIGLYYSGAYLGPTLAFMGATPIINPAAVFLAYGLLDPRVATIYILAGFTLPFLLGTMGNLFGGSELFAPGFETSSLMAGLESCSEKTSFRERIWTGLQWGFKDLGAVVSKYVILGMLLAGLISAAVPPAFFQNYLGNPGLISIVGIALLGTIMYVCAVGHIPFIAALVASGASPGVVITFLMTGAATNLPELISIYKLIGKRAAAIYVTGTTIFSMLVGYATNLILQDYNPFLNFHHNQRLLGTADWLVLSAPAVVNMACSLAILCLGIYSLWPKITSLYTKINEA
ncbi:MAG: efflux transporter SaoE [Syntrophomonadaceae bacterium]